MSTDSPIPAAQYLRMSTEQQQYSLKNQAAAIERYAETHGFAIVRTYPDAAKSGLVLKRRSGLRQLLHDVVAGNPGFQAILVYDVSRWGRFQDTDEAAHYEFLCKQAGIPVHYCAEPFANDGALPSVIIKWLKRTMAGEYSRELSAKVFAGHLRMARLGFKQGGAAGFGLRRMLVSPDQGYKQQLQKGQRKSIATDRVILVPGPEDELQWVRRIYSMLIDEKRTVWWITSELNRQKVKRPGNCHRWRYGSVFTILTHPKYTGCSVYGRSTQKLGAPVTRVPESEWVVTPEAFEPIVTRETFDKAQTILRNRTVRKTNQDILEGLRSILSREGRLSQTLIGRAPDSPASTATLRTRFGNLRKAYEMIGYGSPEHFGIVDQRRRSMALRDLLVSRLQEIFPEELTVVQRYALCRPRIRFRSGLLISVTVSRAIRSRNGTVRWLVDPLKGERRLITLLVRLNQANQGIQDLFVVPSVDRPRRFWIKSDDKWLDRGTRLEDLSQFCKIVEAVRLRR